MRRRISANGEGMQGGWRRWGREGQRRRGGASWGEERARAINCETSCDLQTPTALVHVVATEHQTQERHVQVSAGKRARNLRPMVE